MIETNSNIVISKQNIPIHTHRRKSFFVIILIILLLSIFYLLLKSRTAYQSQVAVQKKLPVPHYPTQKEKRLKQWINCSDIREVIEETKNLYVACNGGVLVVDKLSGIVVDQISMTDGLGNAFTTSLVKKDDELFIGTQDGFTRFNLKNRTAQKISVKEGLINGSNIELALDGNDLWVGTFDGLSLYNIQTSKITNFTHELIANTSHYGINNIEVTENAVYLTIQANAYSSGGVGRFDKKTKTWERFDVGSFTSDGSNRIDFFGLAKAGNHIYAMDDNNIWQTTNQIRAAWTKIPSIPEQTLNSNRSIFSFNETLYLINSDILYRFEEAENKLIKIFSTQSIDSENRQNLSWTYLSNDKLFIIDFIQGPNNDDWLTALDLHTLRLSKLNLQGRPKTFNAILATIDEDVILCAENKLWKYSGAKGTFNQIAPITCSGIEEQGISAFIPISHSNKIFMYFQSCGMGCDEPTLYLLNYDDETMQVINFPKELLPKDTPLSYDGYNREMIHFSFDDNSKTHTLSFNANDLSWTNPKEMPKQPSDLSPQYKNRCNRYYLYKLNNNAFNQTSCAQNLETDQYRWEFKQGEFKKNTLSFTLNQENKSTKEKIPLIIPFAVPLDYSPFGENWGTTDINSLTVNENTLMMGSNRGLYIYDPNNTRWKSFTTKEGLISNDIQSFVTNDHIIWIITSGGLSIISKKSMD